MDGDEVGAASSRVELVARSRPATDDVAAEPLEPAGDGGADPPAADDPDRRAVQVAAEQEAPGPRSPHSPARTIRSPSARRRDDREHQRHREVGGGIGQHVGRVADRDPARGGRRDVDVVDADRVVGDHAQVGRGGEQLGVDAVGEQRQQTLGASAAAVEQFAAAAASRSAQTIDLVRRAQAVERRRRAARG